LELTAPFNASALPLRNLRESDEALAAHFRLINHQLRQARAHPVRAWFSCKEDHRSAAALAERSFARNLSQPGVHLAPAS
jgi:hypothetical protein